MSTTGETAALASYVVGTDYEKLPPDVALQGKRVILDTLGVLLADSRLKLGIIMTSVVRQLGGRPESTVVGSDFKTSCVNAALVNGTFGHGDELDDAHGPSTTHAAAVVVPAALAVAERQRTSGRELINAVVLGYDVGCRVVLALGPQWLRQHNFHPSCIGGCFGAAAAASRLLKLNHRQTVYPLALAGSQASGVLAWMTEREHMAKSLQTGVAARNGVTAALLAMAGYEGPEAIFEGRFNIFEAFSNERNCAAVLDGLGARYEITRTSLKKYSAGHPIHAPLDGLLQIVNEQSLQAEDIAEITVSMASGAADIVDGRETTSISLHNILAVGVVKRKMGMEESHSEELANDPKVVDLRGRIKVVRDAELSKEYPPRQPARVAVLTKNGQMFTQYRADSPGEPTNPLSQQEIEDKFVGLAVPVVGGPNAARVVRLCNELEDLGNVASLADLLRTPPAGLGRTT